MDMVRAGIILYGLWPSDEVDRSVLDLKPVLSLKSHVVHIKTLEPGRIISYGRTYEVTQAFCDRYDPCGIWRRGMPGACQIRDTY